MPGPQYDEISTKQQLGKPDELGLFVFQLSDTVLIRSGPIIVKQRDVENDPIWDQTLWDDNNWAEDWENEPVVQHIANPENNFRDLFSTELFIDEDNTTGSINTTTAQITFADAQVMTSLPIYYSIDDSRELGSATLFAEFSGDLAFEVSPDGGSTWISAPLNENISFAAATGTDLRYRCTSTGASVLRRVRVQYELL